MKRRRLALVGAGQMGSSHARIIAESALAEFATGATPIDVCARTIRSLIDLGAKHFYVSNLPIHRASAVLRSVLAKAGLTDAASPPA